MEVPHFLAGSQMGQIMHLLLQLITSCFQGGRVAARSKAVDKVWIWKDPEFESRPGDCVPAIHMQKGIAVFERREML